LLYNWLRTKVKKAAPYEKLALIYDFVMRHVDYGMWVDYVLQIYKELNFQPESLLDSSCGTGSFLINMQHSVRSVYGCDGSLPMVQQARKKENLEKIPVWVGDMRRIGLKRKVNAIVCLYDSINYLRTPDEIQLALENFYDITSPGGVLVFDICTIQNSELNFSNYYETKKEKDFAYTRWSHFDRKKQIQYTEFQIKFKGDGALYHEVHRQRIYHTETFFDIIDKTKWKLAFALDGFSFESANHNSNRIHFVLRKQETTDDSLF